jgi:neutral ceramidase
MRTRLTFAWAERELPSGIGTDLTGFLNRDNPCLGQRDSLKARAMYLNDSRTGLVWVNVDILGLGQALVERVRTIASERHKMPPRSFAITATHTHSAPASLFLANCGIVDRDWNRELEDTIIGVIDDAVQARKKRVFLRFAQTDAPGYTYNRRTHTSDGKPLRDDTGQALDTRLSVITAHETRDSEPVGAIVHYACHPVFYRDSQISADYPGVLIEGVKADLGSDFPVMFLQGADADINPLRPTDDDEADARRMGSGLATHAIELIRDGEKGTRLTPKLNTRLRMTTLTWVRDPEVQEIEPHLLDAAEWTRAEKVDQALHMWAKRALAAKTRGWWFSGLRVPVQVTCFGELIVAGAGVELFGETARCIEEAHSPRPVLTIGYANDLAGYLPPASEFEHGGYEIDTAYKYYGYPECFSPDAEETVRQTIDSILSVGTMAAPKHIG